MKTSLLILLLGLPLHVLAGSSDAVIRGKTASGRTEFEVRVGDIDGLIRFVRLKIDGESYSIKDAASFPQTVIRDRKNRVYVLSLRAKGKDFRLWMIPNSEKVTKEGSGVYRSRFSAILEATDPRKDDGSLTPRITIGCSLYWEI